MIQFSVLKDGKYMSFNNLAEKEKKKEKER
jgi:hypothetical protein